MSPTNDDPDQSSEETPDRPGHEQLDVDPYRIVVGAIALGIGTVIVALVVAGGYAYLEGIGFGAVFERETDDIEAPLPPEPRLERNPFGHGRRVEAEQRRRLQQWEWIDRETGTAKIPIDRAMDLMVEHYQQGRGPLWDRGGESTEPPPPGRAPLGYRGGESTEPPPPGPRGQGQTGETDTTEEPDEDGEPTEEPGDDEREADTEPPRPSAPDEPGNGGGPASNGDDGDDDSGEESTQ